MSMTLERLARMIGAELNGPGALAVKGVNSLKLAEPGEVTYAEGIKYLEQVKASRATGVVVPKDFPDVEGVVLLRVDKPKIAFVRVTEWFYPTPPLAGIHPSAFVHEHAQVNSKVTIGPKAVISAGAVVGEGSVIQAGAFIGPAVVVGEACVIGPNSSLLEGVSLGDRVTLDAGVVIGGQGFGYVWIDDHHHKVPQVGIVAIEDDVDIGSNTCIDRAAFGITRVGRGTKIDNLVHIAHNNDIGEDVIITGQVGFSGSVTVGDRAMFGGQSGVSDHVRIGEGAKVGGATPVISDVAPGEMVWGFPGKLMARARREMASLSRLPDLLKKVRQQERDITLLREQLADMVEKRTGGE